MRIALVNPPWMYKRLYTHGIYPPYGLLMVATLLQRAGHDVRIVDANARDLDDDGLRNEIIQFDPHALGVTVFTDGYDFIARTGPWWKAAFPGRPFVIGGPLVSGAPETCLRGSMADVGTLGEAFASAPLLFDALERGQPLETVTGLALHKADGSVVRTGPTPAVDRLDALPLPDWELLDVRRYVEGNTDPYFKDQRLRRYLSTITTLGCPFRCTFCQVPSLYEGVRKRSPQSVADEVAGYVQRYGIEAMYFRDDILFRPEQIGAAIQKQTPGLRWSCLLRADMMTDARVGQMRDGGCAEIRVGFESGDDLVLAQANKRTEVVDNVHCIEVCRRQGVQISGFLIVGLPGETEASLAATERFVRDTGVRVSVHFPLPLPGTELFAQGKRDGLIPDEAALLRAFSEPQLPGMVLQPPPVNYCALPEDVLVAWAMRIAEVGRGDAKPAAAPAQVHVDAPF